jgi:ribulose-5-phosphate 4-epimerase/fuculose-1-phosphate aldolase
LLARALHREGFNDHTAGHITIRMADDTLLLNPWEITWDRLTAGDVLRIDLDGNLLEGRYTVTPGVELHLAVHRQRPDVGVLVHNHPEWTLVWSALGVVPPIYDQTGALVRTDRIRIHDQYRGTVGERDVAEENVAEMGDADAMFLLNHGLLVQADTVERAFVRCMSIEWRSKLAWRVAATGLPGRTIPDDVANLIADRCDARPDAGWPHLWAAMCERELADDPRVVGTDRS